MMLVIDIAASGFSPGIADFNLKVFKKLIAAADFMPESSIAPAYFLITPSYEIPNILIPNPTVVNRLR
ncbi:MAG: hypothetical protein ACOYVF_11025 [Candidatus Zixiibacteriota bacterium]